LGDGERITALPPLSAIIVLFAGVAAGLVEGHTAATTPTGLAYSVMPSAVSSPMTPTDFAPVRSRKVPMVLRWFLVTLSATQPRPVAATLSSASALARSGS
jgi:hypothetical protein